MAIEFPEGDEEAWRGEEDEEEMTHRVKEIIFDLERFNDFTEISEREIEDMVDRIDGWDKKYSNLKDKELLNELTEALRETMVNVALQYLDIFLKYEFVDSHQKKLVWRMIKVLKYKENEKFIYATDFPEYVESIKTELQEKIALAKAKIKEK